MRTLAKIHQVLNPLICITRINPSKIKSILIGISLLMVSSFSLIAQSDNCSEAVAYFDSEATLCESHSNFTPSVTLGTGTNYASQIPAGSLTGNILIAGDFYVDQNFLIYNAVVKIA